jgi:predicted outer membrane repeat protein
VYVTVGNSRFEYNSALKYGGAIYAYADDDTVIVDIDSSTFTHNDAAVHGGAVFAKSNSGYERVDVGEGSEFAHNHAGGAGGAVHSHGLVRVAGLPSDPVTFSDDTAGFGGAILTRLGGAITGAVFERNIGGDGGAVYSYGNLAVADSTFSENRAIGTHGGALSVDGDLSLERSAVVGNYAKFNGGGLIVFGDVARVDNSFIGGNRAGDIAGAIWMDLPSSNVLELNFSTVYDDTVLPGGSGPSGIQTGSIRATMSAVGSSSTSDIWEFSGTVDDTASVSSADDTVFDGEGSGNVAPGTLSFGAFDGDLPGTYGRTPEADSVLAVAAGPSPLGFAPADNPLPSISRDQLDVERIRPFTIGARQYVAPTPPAPAPATPASPPREVTAVAGVQSAVVSWAAPSSSGSFPVTSYQVTSSPGGHGCLVSAPALTCTITGLTAGDSYTFVAKALTGAGWSSSSAPSNAVVPEGQPDAKAILITSSRDRIAPSIVRVDGTTTGLVGEQVTPQVRKPGQTGFTPGWNVRTVDANGRFTWQRKSGKKLYVYFTSGDVRSNRLVIGPA